MSQAPSSSPALELPVMTLAESSAAKRRVARNSMVAAAAMTILKLTAGLLSGSLGVLSDAAHSALDLVGVALTFFSVQVSDKPADEDHTYGHGKVENLTAFCETILMALSCAWIIYERSTASSTTPPCCTTPSGRSWSSSLPSLSTTGAPINSAPSPSSPVHPRLRPMHSTSPATSGPHSPSSAALAPVGSERTTPSLGSNTLTPSPQSSFPS